jgi:hypothetical protein
MAKYSSPFSGVREEHVRHKDGWNRKEKEHQVPEHVSNAGSWADDLINDTVVQGQQPAPKKPTTEHPGRYQDSVSEVNDYVDTDEDGE